MDSHTESTDAIHLYIGSVAIKGGGFHDALDNSAKELGGTWVEIETSLLLS